MSVIVYDGDLIAADLMVNTGGSSWAANKLGWLDDYIFTAFGDQSNALKLIAQFREYKGPYIPQSKYFFTPYATMIYVDRTTHNLYRYAQDGSIVDHGKHKAAFGTGKDFAYGALAVGANATNAVKAALKYSPTCGIGVQTINVNTGAEWFDEYKV